MVVWGGGALHTVVGGVPNLLSAKKFSQLSNRFSHKIIMFF